MQQTEKTKRAGWLFLTILSLTVLACKDDSPPPTDSDGDGTITYTVVDLCDGTEEFLSIPEDADIIFSAGIYAEAPYPDGVESPCELYALDLDGHRIYRVSCSNYAAPTCDYGRVSLSPDRSKAVVLRSCSDTNGDTKMNYLDRKVVCIIDLATGDVIEIPGFNAVNAPDWSVNDEILFAANTPAELYTDIWKVDATGENLQNLTGTQDYLENDCAWSKDGNKIVYARGVLIDVEPPPGETAWQSAIADLYVMDRTGGQQTKVVSFGGDSCTSYTEITVDRYCQGIVVDPDFYPSGDKVTYSMLLSIDENQGRGRWNVFSASSRALDQEITNLTGHATAFQDIARVSDRGIVFHETNQDAVPPFYGLVYMDQQGNNREELVNSQWRYFIQPASWIP